MARIQWMPEGLNACLMKTSVPFVSSVVLLLVIGGIAAGIASAENAQQAVVPDFKKDVLPIFEEKCLHCHGAKRRGGKLDMRTLEAMLEGGDTGPAFKPGKAKKSLLIELIHHKEMPPKKEKNFVTTAELELLRRWIDAMPAKS
jgi:mono/diheme cytochrome c family protein